MPALIVCVALGFPKTYFDLSAEQFFSLSAMVHIHAATAGSTGAWYIHGG